MTWVFKIIVLVAALIAGEKCRNWRAEGSDRTANGFRTFWGQNSDVLRLRSTGWNFGSVKICTWYQREDCGDIGVNVSRWSYYVEQKRVKDQSWFPKYFWKFGENDSMWRYDAGGMKIQYLLYKESDGSCGVIGSQYYMFADENLKAELVQECKEKPGGERCKGAFTTILNDTDGNCIPNPKEPGKLLCGEELNTAIEKKCKENSGSQQCEMESPCIPHPTGPAKYLCRDHAYYDLLLSIKKSDVPPGCEEFYTVKMGESRDTRIRNISDCKPEQE